MRHITVYVNTCSFKTDTVELSCLCFDVASRPRDSGLIDRVFTQTVGGSRGSRAGNYEQRPGSALVITATRHSFLNWSR